MYKRFFENKKTYKSFFQEYVVENISWLKKYLTMSDEEKGQDLLFKHPYIIDNYEEELLNRAEEIGDDEAIELINNAEWYELAEYVDGNKKYVSIMKSAFKRFSQNAHDYNIPEEQVPTWAHMEYRKIFKNQWLIHFTESANEIAKTGFNNFITEIDKLGLTKWDTYSERAKDGYGFAYSVDDYVKYSKGGDYMGWKYGSEAVLFLASGLEVYHWGDSEAQHIFKGDTVKQYVPITQGEELDFAVYNKKSGEILYENDDLEKVVDWVLTNYRQYSKVL